jgi:hypothetical protein
MEIGRHDVCFKHNLSQEQIILNIFIAVKSVWSSLTFEEDKKEIFIYKTNEDKLSWDKFGRTSYNAKNMIHFSFNENELWVVIEDLLDEETKTILSIIEEFLK